MHEFTEIQEVADTIIDALNQAHQRATDRILKADTPAELNQILDELTIEVDMMKVM